MNTGSPSIWFHADRGKGRVLVLLHGIGMSHQAWKPVMPLLATSRRVLAFDIAGFGRTPPLPADTEPTPENLALALRASLQQLGIDAPADIVGNSMGGRIALECARLGMARSVVALSPSGLWPDRAAPAHVHAVLRATRWAVRRMPKLSERMMRSVLGRTVALMLPVTRHGWRLSRSEALGLAETLGKASAFDATLEAGTRFVGGRELQIPLTVAFGTCDWLLTRSCQRRDELPAHTRWLHPEGWGHVPMWDDPDAVAELILQGSA